MKGLQMMLAALGIKLTVEQIHQAEDVIPKLPGLVNQASTAIGQGLQNFDARLTTLESRMQGLETKSLLTNELLTEIVSILQSEKNNDTGKSVRTSNRTNGVARKH